MGLAIWKSVDHSGNEESAIESSVNPQMRTSKHAADRESLARKKRLTREPAADFFERARRGMTEQEIRWMISEFEAMQVLSTSVGQTESRSIVEKLHDWRLRALDEALSLSHEQKRELGDSFKQHQRPELLDLFRLDKEGLHTPLSKQHLQSANFFGDDYSWKYSSLTENQINLTYKKSIEAEYEARRKNAARYGWSDACHDVRLIMMHGHKSGEYVVYPSPSDLNFASWVYDTTSGGIIDVSNTFPLTPDQQLERHRNDILAQAKLLHPAQLRMALLNPGVAKTLKYELDKSTK